VTAAGNGQLSQPRIGRPGLVIDQRYRLEELLGSGGFGEVWRASQEVEGESVRPVALKLLPTPAEVPEGTPPQADSTPGGGHAWLNEVRAVRDLHHDAVTTIFDVGIARQPRVAFIAMEMLRGTTLAERLAEGPIYWRRSLAIAREVASALHACHQVGVCHCDLKPQNVFLAEDGRVRVVDFGIATLGAETRAGGVPLSDGTTASPGATDETGVVSIDELPDAPSGTTGRPVAGTPGYIPPEGYSGEAPGPEGDVYALGVLLYQMIAGALPYRLPADLDAPTLDSTSREEVMRYRTALSAATIHGDVEPLSARAPEVPSAVAALIDRMLSLEAGARPLADLIRLLDEVWTRPHGIPDPPYIGLEAFDERRAGYIAGRDADIRAVAEKLRDRRAIVLSGPSGCGKSSLAVAGVEARIDEELLDGLDGWRAIVVRPTTNRGALQIAPTGGNSPASPRVGTVVVVDQLEEVLALDDEERDRFCAALAALAKGTAPVRVVDTTLGADDPTRVIATVRDDLFGRVAALPSLERFPEENLYTVRGVEPNAIAAIVAAPAKRSGFTLDDEEAVEAEAARVLTEDPSALPLVQFALTRWWEARDEEGKRLPREEWKRIGGIEGALAQAAQALYDKLDPAERERMRAVLLQLFTVEGTRVRVPEEELAKDDETRRLLERRRVRSLVRRHVDSENRASLEVVHEALSRRWPLLRSWLEETRAERELLQYLRVEARRWRESDEPAEMLWGGDRLASAQKVVDKAEEARGFIEAAAGQEQRRRMVRRTVLAGTMAGLVVVAIVLFFAYRAANRARAEAEAATDKLGQQTEEYVVQQEELSTRQQQVDELRSQADKLRTAQEAAQTESAAERDRLREDLRRTERQYKMALKGLDTANQRTKTPAPYSTKRKPRKGTPKKKQKTVIRKQSDNSLPMPTDNASKVSNDDAPEPVGEEDEQSYLTDDDATDN